MRRDKVVLYFIIREENNSSYFELRAQDLSLLSYRAPNTELWQQLNFLDIEKLNRMVVFCAYGFHLKDLYQR